MRSPISSSAIAAEHQDRALQEQRRPVDRDRDRPAVMIRSSALRTTMISAASTASSASVELHQVPPAPGHERLDQHAEQADAEQDQHRRERRVVDRRAV